MICECRETIVAESCGFPVSQLCGAEDCRSSGKIETRHGRLIRRERHGTTQDALRLYRTHTSQPADGWSVSSVEDGGRGSGEPLYRNFRKRSEPLTACSARFSAWWAQYVVPSEAVSLGYQAGGCLLYESLVLKCMSQIDPVWLAYSDSRRLLLHRSICGPELDFAGCCWHTLRSRTSAPIACPG